MILYVVRHGETDFNVQNRYAGSTNVPLNTVGELQAENLAEKMADVEFDTASGKQTQCHFGIV